MPRKLLESILSMKRFVLVCGTLVAPLLSESPAGGVESAASASLSVPERSPLSWESQFRFSIVGNSDYTDGPREFGDVSSLDFRLRAVASLPLSSNVLLRAGVDWEQTHFDAPD